MRFAVASTAAALRDLAEVKIAARSLSSSALVAPASRLTGVCARARFSSPVKFANSSCVSKEAVTRRPFSSLKARAAPNTRSTLRSARRLTQTPPQPAEAAPRSRSAPPQKAGRALGSKLRNCGCFKSKRGRDRLSRATPAEARRRWIRSENSFELIGRAVPSERKARQHPPLPPCARFRARSCATGTAGF